MSFRSFIVYEGPPLIGPKKSLDLVPDMDIKCHRVIREKFCVATALALHFCPILARRTVGPLGMQLEVTRSIGAKWHKVGEAATIVILPSPMKSVELGLSERPPIVGSNGVARTQSPCYASENGQ